MVSFVIPVRAFCGFSHHRSSVVGLDQQHHLLSLAAPQLSPKRLVCSQGDFGGYSLEDSAWPCSSAHCPTPRVPPSHAVLLGNAGDSPITF